MILDKDFKEFNLIYKGEENNGILQWENKKKKELEDISYEKIRNELERLEEHLDQLKYNKSSQKIVAEQIFKEFILLICSLVVTTIFSIMNVIGDVVSAQANNFSSATSIDLTFDLIMEYVSGTLSISTLILEIFLVFMFITSFFHIILSVFETKRTEKNIREIRYYNYLIGMCEEKIKDKFNK